MADRSPRHRIILAVFRSGRAFSQRCRWRVTRCLSRCRGGTLLRRLSLSIHLRHTHFQNHQLLSRPTSCLGAICLNTNSTQCESVTGFYLPLAQSERLCCERSTDGAPRSGGTLSVVIGRPPAGTSGTRPGSVSPLPSRRHHVREAAAHGAAPPGAPAQAVLPSPLP
jgi:hypothetical protein